MLYRITFHQLSAILLDFVDSSDGFLYLRLVGAESTVNAIWARLSAKEGRGKKWTSAVQIPITGQSYPKRVAACKGVTYRTLRARLPSGMVDLAMIHPLLTVAEDSERGFYLVTYDQGCPPAFFARLNQCLSIPLKPDWAAWLWRCGQQSQAFWSLKKRTRYEDHRPVEVEELVEETALPITRLDSLGQVACYTVKCDGDYKAAWLQIIRAQLQLGLRLRPEGSPAGGQRYGADGWTVTVEMGTWTLHRDGETLLSASSRHQLLTQARETLGLHVILQEE